MAISPTANAHFRICREDETANPRIHRLGSENPFYTGRKRKTARASQTNEKDSAVRTGGEPTDVGKVEVLGDEESLRRLCGGPDSGIVAAAEVFGRNGIDVMSKLRQ